MRRRTARLQPDRAAPLSVRLTPEAFFKRPGGVRRTAVDLLAALRETRIDISVSSSVDRYRDPVKTGAPALVRGLSQLSETAYFTGRRLAGKTGVAHSLYYDQQLRPPGWPLVVTVHDMIHEQFAAGGFALRQAKRLSIARAALIITPSRATASELLRIYPDTRAEVVTIPWGISTRFTAAARSDEIEIDRPFILYLGPRAGYKNFVLLTRALSAARDLDDHRLVIVGGERLTKNERAGIVEALGSSRRLIHLQRPSDDALVGLYDHAAVLVVTSRCEGFGLPLLEAMTRGCPVAYAEGGSSPELVECHAAAFSPDSPDGCARGVREAIATTAAQRHAANVHARRFDWSTTAEAHIAAYENIRTRG